MPLCNIYGKEEIGYGVNYSVNFSKCSKLFKNNPCVF